MMNWVCCSLTYVFVLFLIYTPLDHSVVESSPIPDGPQNNVDPNTGLAPDTDTAKNIVNIDTNNNNEVEQKVNRDQGNNNIIDGREGGTAENQQHDAEEDDDGVLNEDVKEGIVPGREDIKRNEQDAEFQTALEDEVAGNVEHSVQEDGQSMRMSDHSAQKEDLLPADLQEGHAVEPGRNQALPVNEELYQNVNAAQDAVHNPQNDSAVQDPQNDKAVQNLNTVHEQQHMPNPGTEIKYPSENKKPNPYDINETLRKLGIMVDRPYVPKSDQTVGNPSPVQTIRSDQYQAQRTSVNDTGNVQKDVIHQGLWDKPQTTQPHGNVETAEHQSQRLVEASPGGQIEQPFGSQSRQSYIPVSQPSPQDNNSVAYSRDSHNDGLSNNLQQSLSSQEEVDVPEEFNADSTSREDPQADNHYSDDGYLDAPGNNLDNDRNAQDKTDEDVNRNNNNYDDSSDPNANLNNKNIIDDNNEQVLYDSAYQEENKKDEDESYENTLYDDKDDYSYEEKIDRLDGDESKSTTPSNRDSWYQGDTDDIVEGKDNDVNDTDFVDTVIDEEVDFQRTHVKHPQTDDNDNSLYFSNGDPQIQEGVVEYKLIKNRNSLNAPSSMVLFYTWIILIVLIAVVTLSAFRYRCKGIINGQRNHRNGNHGSYRNGEESKKLLENVYT